MDGSGLEAGGFHEDGGRVVAYVAVEAPHDPGQGYGARAVAYREHVAVQYPVFFVQGSELFPVFGAPYVDMSSGQAVVVEGMERLAVFEHNVIADVDDIVYRPLSGRDEPFLQPRRGFGNLDVGDERGAIAGTKFLVLYLYGHFIIYIFPGFFVIDAGNV